MPSCVSASAHGCSSVGVTRPWPFSTCATFLADSAFAVATASAPVREQNASVPCACQVQLRVSFGREWSGASATVKVPSDSILSTSHNTKAYALNCAMSPPASPPSCSSIYERKKNLIRRVRPGPTTQHAHHHDRRHPRLHQCFQSKYYTRHLEHAHVPRVAASVCGRGDCLARRPGSTSASFQHR